MKEINPVALPTYEKNDVELKLKDLEEQRIKYIKDWLKTKYILIAAIIMSIFMIFNYCWFYTANTEMNASITFAHLFVSLLLPILWLEPEVLKINTHYKAEVELRFQLGLNLLEPGNIEQFRYIDSIKEDTIFFKN